MGLYHVVKPGVVGGLHYVRPTVQPIEVGDEVAAPAVGAGVLVPFRAAVAVEGCTGDALGGVSALAEAGQAAGEEFAQAIAEAPKPRGRRRPAED